MKLFVENKKLLPLFLAGLLGGVASLWAYFSLVPKQVVSIEEKQNAVGQQARYASLSSTPAFDFTGVCEIANPAVVHIISTIKNSGSAMGNNGRNQQMPMDPFEFFYGPGFEQQRPSPREASGSGVILSEDGFIVTNNHVIEGASKIVIVLNDKRSYEAELVGTDPNTDIALLRIPEKSLPFLKLGNSDAVKVGQWVIAVGNPLNLNSTVTLGIVSAMGRNIDLIRSKGNNYAIENFIQTDAAINPGNSGGALVNVAGELIGINTAIASETGSYAGYGFAIPVNLLKKVVNDIMNFGKVQRALLGVSIREISQELALEYGLSDLKGVFVADLIQGGAAEKSGIKQGDVILKVAGTEVNTSSRLQEEVGKYRPGDKVIITIRRKKTLLDIETILLNTDGKAKVDMASADETEAYLGMNLVNASREEKMALGIKYGVKVKDIGKGIFKDVGISSGFVIVFINNEPVYSAKDVVTYLKSTTGTISIEGFTASGVNQVFALKLPPKSQN